MFCGLPPALASEHTSPSDSPLPHFLLQGGGAPLPGTRPLDPTIDGAGHTITIAPRCSIAEATAVDLAHPAAQAKGAGFCILFCWVSDAHLKITETAATSLFLRILFMKKCSFSISPRLNAVFSILRLWFRGLLLLFCFSWTLCGTTSVVFAVTGVRPVAPGGTLLAPSSSRVECAASSQTAAPGPGQSEATSSSLRGLMLLHIRWPLRTTQNLHVDRSIPMREV